ncbi:unnamed protein product [Arabidopsis lyrata]|nr:unnamed protein product [Arabidopsis lyrata]
MLTYSWMVLYTKFHSFGLFLQLQLRRRYMKKTGPCETWWTQEAPKDISLGKRGS